MLIWYFCGRAYNSLGASTSALSTGELPTRLRLKAAANSRWEMKKSLMLILGVMDDNMNQLWTLEGLEMDLGLVMTSVHSLSYS